MGPHRKADSAASELARSEFVSQHRRVAVRLGAMRLGMLKVDRADASAMLAPKGIRAAHESENSG